MTVIPMTKSGFCQWPGLDNAHRFCQTENCTCTCGHLERENAEN